MQPESYAPTEAAAPPRPPGTSSREDRRTQAERSETTREQLITTGRRLFAEKGFAATSIEELVRAAGVTKGAMYHHFGSKEELFEAVFEREQRAVGEHTRTAAMKKKGAWQQLKAGCDEFLTASLDPQTQQILMIDGPAVLGSARSMQIDELNSMHLLSRALEKSMDEGTIAKRPVMPLAQLLFGALCQAAMVAARSDDPTSTMRQMRKELQRMLNALEGS